MSPSHVARIPVAYVASQWPESSPGLVAQQRIESVASYLTPEAACAVIDHHFGVLPLLKTFFDSCDTAVAAVMTGRRLGGLGLFTPTPEHCWGAASLVAEPATGGWRLQGRVRLPSQVLDGSIVLVRVDSDLRLAWLDLDTPGVTRQRAVTPYESPRASSPCWISVEGATIPAALISRPVTLAADSDLHARLDIHAAAWAFIAIDCAQRGLRAFRSAIKSVGSDSQSRSPDGLQNVEMDITQLEIEADLVAAAARYRFSQVPWRRADAAGVSLGVSAARVLTQAGALVAGFSDQLGVFPDTPLAQHGAASAMIGHVGGTLMLEHELARARGLTSAGTV